MKILHDTWLVLQRQLLESFRAKAWIIIGIVQPVVYLLLFAPLLRTALGAGSTQAAYGVFVPGLLVLLALVASLFAGMNLIQEVRSGGIDRCRATPVSRLALLLGRAVRDVISIAVQAIIVLILSVAFGLRANLGHVLLAFVLLGLTCLMLSSLSYLLALKLGSEQSMSPLVQLVTQPLILLSGIMLPLSFAPGWLRSASNWNPFAYLVNAMRALFAGDLGAPSVWQTALIMAALCVITVTAAGRAFLRPAR
jgi:ABC-2 type transport system permease protein